VENVTTTDSLKKRYLAKLLSSLVGFALSLITVGMVPRALGPADYGNFSFLTFFFSQASIFFLVGTPFAFYTKLSQRQHEYTLVAFYLYFFGFSSLLLLCFTSVAYLSGTNSYFWPSQGGLFVYLAVGLAVVGRGIVILQNMVDAYGLTVSGELFNIFIKIISVILICSLYFYNVLNLFTYFLYSYFIQLILGSVFIFVLYRYGYLVKNFVILHHDEAKKYITEFYHYSHPLFIYSAVVFFAVIFNRWMLQFFAGSVEQGFFALSDRIGTICFLFTAPMTPLIMREFSLSFEKNDLEEMARLFRRYVPMLYAIAAYFACFIAVEASKVVYIIGGEKFQHATLAVIIMAFYPIHQTYGQLSGSIFYATGQTKLYRNIGVTFIILGLPVTYFLIAPVKMMGLDAGATGLAIKMVSMQFISVNVQFYFNARLLKLRFWRYIGHQIVSVACLLGVAAISMLVVDKGIGLHDKVILSFLLSGVLYTFMVMALGYVQPILFGLTRRDIHSLIQSGIHKFR
jgi:O-antigen/teichoic acid export membrane protein